MSLLRRHIMMQQGGGGSILPNEYQQVEYIKTVGNISINQTDQYIDTGVTFTSETRIGLICSFVDCGTYDFGYFWGQGANAYGGRYAILAGNASYIQYNSGWGIGGTIPIDHSSVYTYEMDANEIVCNGISYASSWLGSSYGSVYLFRSNRNTVTCGAANIRIMRSYSLVNGELTSDLYPCYRKSDGVAGMYDIINNIFRTNLGNGSFIVGPNV